MPCSSTLYLLVATLGLGIGGCDRDVPLAVEPQAQVPPQAQVTALPGCATVEFQVSGSDRVTATFPDLSRCPSGLVLVPGDPAAFDRPGGGRLRLSVHVVNRSAEAITLPVRLLLHPDSAVVLFPPGLARNGKKGVTPQNAMGTIPAGEPHAGAWFWNVGTGVELTAGAKTHAVEVVFVVESGVQRMRLGFGAEAAVLDTGRPPIPPAVFFFPAETAYAAVSPADTMAIYYRRVVGIRFDDSTSGSTVREVLTRYQATIIAGSPNVGAYIVRVPDPGPTYQALEALVLRLSVEPGVDFAFGITFRGAASPQARYPTDGPGARRGAWLQSPLGTAVRAWQTVRAPLAWGCETGAYGSDLVRVGVVDFFFDPQHDDLRGNFAGMVTPGQLGLPPDARLQNPGFRTHGTMVAGILTAEGDNSLGIAGIVWASRLHLFALSDGVSVAPDPAWFLAETILPSAKAAGVRVLVSSVFVGSAEPAQAALVEKGLRDYLDAGTGNLFVQAVGNSTVQMSVQQLLNARKGDLALLQAAARLVTTTHSDRILLVAGADDQGQLWNDQTTGLGSNVIKGATAIAAPASRIRSIAVRGLFPGDVYDTSGTSLAAPFVGGVAGLLWAMEPSLTPGEVKRYIRDGAREPRVNPQSGLPEPPKKIGGTTEEIYQLDAYGTLALLSRERSGVDLLGVPICAYPVSARVASPEGVLLARAPGDTGLIPVPGLLALASVAQGGRQLAVVVQNASLNVETRVIDHRGNLLAILPPDVLERHFLERDTADLVRGDVVLPDGSVFPKLRLWRHGGTDTTIQVFQNLPPDLQQVFMTFVAASPAGDAAATGWSGVTGAGVVMRWDVVPLGAGTPTRVRDASQPQFVPGQNYTNVASVLLSRAAWSHDGRRVVFPLLRQDLDWFGDFEWITVDGSTEILTFVGGQSTQGTVDHWAVLEPRFSPDDVVLHTRDQRFDTGACRFTRRSGLNASQELTSSAVDCGSFFTPPEIFPNVRQRPPPVPAAADTAGVALSSGPSREPLWRRAGCVQAH